jgi:hypothetical protein
LQQFFDFLAGEQARIGLTAVGGDVQGHAIEVGVAQQVGVSMRSTRR